MSRKAPKAPKEDDSVIAARERQILDLSKADEEENRRIKQMRTVSRGVRAFRATRGASRGSSSRGVGGSSSVGSMLSGNDGSGDSFEAQYRAMNGG